VVQPVLERTAADIFLRKPLVEIARRDAAGKNALHMENCDVRVRKQGRGGGVEYSDNIHNC